MGKKRYGIEDEKPVEVKGVETGGPEITKRDPFETALSKAFPKAYHLKQPKDQKEAFAQEISSRAGAPSTTNIRGFSGTIDTETLKQVYAPVNLAQGIPDYYERKKFIEDHGQKMVKLFDDDTFGIKFERDLEDIVKFKEQAYPHAVKNFIDELEENQSWAREYLGWIPKLLGSVVVGTAGNLVGSIYGGLNAIIAGDVDKFYDNEVMDFLDWAQEGIDTQLVTYGGSDIWDFEMNPETGIPEFRQKDFLARFWNDPFKSLNADVVPTVAFLADVVVSESIATAVTGATGGLGFGALAANTARLTSRASRLTNRMAKFGKANRFIRGLDDIDDIARAAQVERMTQNYRKVLGTTSAAYRSSYYESALIGRDTKEQTYNALLEQWYNQNDPGRQKGLEPDEGVLAEFRRTAEESGELAYMMNIPLVAGSNFVQMPRLFARNYKVASAAQGSFDKWKLGGVRYAGGKYTANAEASKMLKTLGYSKAILKGPVTEAWEEFAQGAMSGGLVDYHVAQYSGDAQKEKVGMLNSIVKHGQSYLNTVEGRDSLTLGGLMGLLGIRVPMIVRNKNSKNGFSLTTKGFGGSRQEFIEARRRVNEAREKAEMLNSDENINPVLAENFKNTIRHMEIQKDMDAAANAGDIHTYKNKEFDQLFSLVQTRAKMGMGDTVLQDLERAKEMPLDQFNETYGIKGLDEHTEESRQEAIANAQQNVEKMLKSIDDVNVLMSKAKPDMVQKLINKIRKRNPTAFETLQKNSTIQDLQLIEQFKDQLQYLHAVVQNTTTREAQLTQEIDEAAGQSLNVRNFDQVVAQIIGVDLESSKLGFKNQAKEVKKEILKDWKERDPNSYHLNVQEVSPLLDDILELKIRRGEAAKFYQGLFDPKKAEGFMEFTMQLKEEAAKRMMEESLEQAKKNAEEARNASMAKEGKNEASITGNTNITDNVIHPQVMAGLKEYDEVMADETLSKENKIEAAISLLDKHPGLFTIVKDRLLDKNIPIQGIATAQQLEMEDVDGTLIAAVLSELPVLSKEAKARAAADAKSGPNVKNADQMNQSQASSKTGPSFSQDQIEAELRDGPYAFINRTNNSFTIVNTLDKAIDGGKTRLGPDGRPVPHIAKGTARNPIDTDKVNSPDFLNNKQLRDENHYFEFRIQHDNPYNDQEGTDVDNLAISIIHIDPQTGEETFISMLPAYEEGESARHLKALREEIVRRDGLEDDGAVERNVARIKEIKAEKATIKEELAKGPTETVPDDKTLEEKIEEVKENQEFIVLSEDEKTYTNSRTGKEYQRVSNYISDDAINLDVDKINKELNQAIEKGDNEKAAALQSELARAQLIKSSTVIGTKVDELVRDFFAGNVKDYAEYDLVEDVTMIDSFLESLQEVKDKMDERGEEVLANDIVLYNDELGIAGTVDLLTVDAEGNVRIYDMKTMRGDQFTDKHRTGDNAGKTKYEHPYDNSKMSNQEKHQAQLSMYRLLLQNTHGLLADTIGIMPIQVMYESGDTQTSFLKLLKGKQLDPLNAIKEATVDASATDPNKEALKKKLDSLNEELKGLTEGALDVEFTLEGSTLFGDLTDLEAIPEMATERKEQKEKELLDTHGQENLDRAKVINENFDDIVAQIVGSGINVFFDARRNDRSTAEQHKRC